MPVQARDLFKAIEDLAPLSLAEEWDNCGLQLGDPRREVKRAMLALDMDENVAREAVDRDIQTVILHHPLFFKPIKQLRTDGPAGRLIAFLIKAGLVIYAAHTNLDSVKNGVNDELAKKLGLQNTNTLAPNSLQRFYKLVTFVPTTHADEVRSALGRAGAGWIGNYSECTFRAQGVGTFRPLEGTNPFTGQPGKLEQVEEMRLETIFPVELRSRILKAMLQAHPYEEVAYDLYPLANQDTASGLGRTGELALPMAFPDFIQHVKDSCGINRLRYGGDLKKHIRKVAVCGGAGAKLWPAALAAQADVLVTGDIDYHTARDILTAGLNFIDAGHFGTEQLVLPVLKAYLNQVSRQNDWHIEIYLSCNQSDPFLYA